MFKFIFHHQNTFRTWIKKKYDYNHRLIRRVKITTGKAITLGYRYKNMIAQHAVQKKSPK